MTRLTLLTSNWAGLTYPQKQVLAWPSVTLLVFFTLLPEDSAGEAIAIALVSTLSYALIIYGNINYLFPKLFRQQRFIGYLMLAFFFVLAVSIVRGTFVAWMINRFFVSVPWPLTATRLLTYVANGFFIFFLSFIVKNALDYDHLRIAADRMQSENNRAQLALLKSQVQPHFLFNTLNHIYFASLTEAPRAAGMIEKLADMMRYFVEETPCNRVPIATELEFLENYIGLERLRIPVSVTIDFKKNYRRSSGIPPMLLLTFIENIFKHGIDPLSDQNQVSILLEESPGYLEFSTVNRPAPNPVVNGGTGLSSLQKRLEILYGDKFTLRFGETAGYFCTYLKIPS